MLGPLRGSDRKPIRSQSWANTWQGRYYEARPIDRLLAGVAEEPPARCSCRSIDAADTQQSRPNDFNTEVDRYSFG